MSLVVVTSTDDTFALPTTVMIRSVADHARVPKAIDVYVLDCGLTPRSRRKMNASISRAWIKLHFLPVGQEELNGFRVDGHVSSAAYARLFMGNYLPAGIERVIYIDGDMVALTNVMPLGEMELHGHPMAAVQDPVAGLVGQSAQMMHWEGWDVPRGTHVFNSGLMVLDLPRWRQEGLFERVIQIAREHPDRMKYWDQCALNYVIRGNYLELDPAWNVGQHLYYPPHCHDVIYESDVVERCIREPNILHYGGTWRPWKGPGRHWREAEFYRYLYRTAWRNDVYCAPWMGRGNTTLTKVKRMLKKVLTGGRCVRKP